MFENLLPDVPPRLAVTLARGRSIFRRRPLPPGDLIHLDVLERSDRRLLLNLAAVHGPIFKALAENRLLICIVGLPVGRRLLKELSTALRPVTLELGSLFPKGFMRQMEGDRHREYREALVRGINGLEIGDCLHDLDIAATQGLDMFVCETGPQQSSPHAYLAALSSIASGMLLRVFFGAVPGSALVDRLLAGYRRLGRHGLVWNITEKQTEAYRILSAELRTQSTIESREPGQAFASSLFGQLSGLDAIDDTMLGNLIYMVEMGRYDLRGLFRWISKYAAENPAWIERLINAEKSEPKKAHEIAKAFVLETLRMDQSERLMRNVKQDVVFEGYTIPKGAAVRVCLWEAHKDGDAFPNPFVFDPSKFLSDGGSVDGFSPFGLDHHHCPFSGISITLGVVFLRALARGYRIGATGDGPAVRGAYHWEPAPGFSVTLRRRVNPAQLFETS